MGTQAKSFFSREASRHTREKSSGDQGTDQYNSVSIFSFYWCIWNCLERYREVVGRDWCHMSFGIIAESMLTRYSQNPSQSLGHLRPVTGDDLMFKKTPATYPETVFNDDDDDNNNNNYHYYN